ncbi:uncharacterized protein [Coffea arabica]|uniref:RNase H type-1 domain-containing protein n=1 Tax=Coffea arabica TaxID=13443 RepID=A0ABM4V9Q2_COFAR
MATWRRMWNVNRQVELSMLWQVNEGSCNFWYDNWLGSGALFLRSTVAPGLTFGDFISNGAWDVQLLSRAVPQEIILSILQQPVPGGGRPDEAVWMASTSGKFTLASAFGEVCQARNISAILSRVWHHRIPLKISFFMLRLLMGRLPPAETLCKLGFHMPSKCLCCQSPSCDSIEHLFSMGQVALEAWNKGVFEGELLRPAAVIQAIFSEVKMLLEIQFKGQVGAHTFQQLYDWSGVPVGGYGFQLGNPGTGGGGGVLRDSSGRSLFAFSAYLGETTSLHAETSALLIGLRECVQRGFGNVGIQLDSLVLVGVLQKTFQCPWHIRKEVWQIWQLLGDSPRIAHCYREANKVADILSNVGVTHPGQQVRVYEHLRLIPQLARGALRLDRLGLPSVRKVRMA